MYEPSAFFLHDCFKRSVLKSRPIFIELYFKIQGNSNSTGTLVSLFWKTCKIMNITGFIMSSDLIDTIHTTKYTSESHGQPNHTDFFLHFHS